LIRLEVDSRQMPSHLSFLDDAVEGFLEAFELHRHVAEPGTSELRHAANCVRGFVLALEKGLKHALASIDPYLLIAEPTRKLLVQLRHDMNARAVPNIFCSRQPFETIGIGQTWETLRDLRGHSIPQDTRSAFDRGLKRLIEARNNAYHGEVYGEPDELSALIDEVLARFTAVISCVSPDWLRILSERNGQLPSRLRGIETQVDGNWQVLVDYLRDHGGIEFPITLYVGTGRDRESVDVLFGASDKPNNMLGSSDVPASLATGMFTSFLNKQQIDDRFRARHLPPSGLSAMLLYGLQPVVDDSPLTPLEPGTINVPATSVWLTIHLPEITPHHLFLSAIVSELRVEFSEAGQVTGSVSGRLECPIVKGTAPQRVQIRGTAQLVSEWYSDVDASVDPPKPEATRRTFELQLRLMGESQIASEGVIGT